MTRRLFATIVSLPLLVLRVWWLGDAVARGLLLREPVYKSYQLLSTGPPALWTVSELLS